MIRSVRDDSLSPRIVSRRPLFYSAGADPEEDRPAHVRAGSGLAQFGGLLYIVQDDANFVAEISGETVTSIALPRGEDGRRLFSEADGNKERKLDFESCLIRTIDGEPMLLAFGSGSTAARCRVLFLKCAVWTPRKSPETNIVDASAFYESLRADKVFSGSELNIEGVALTNGTVRFFQRGNGKGTEQDPAINATCEVDAEDLILHLLHGARVPEHSNVKRYDLGDVQGVPLTFTDATTLEDGRILYLAAAEDSPDTYRDGVVVGTALGILETDGSSRHALIRSEDGTPFLGKPEGITVSTGANKAHLVIDRDDPELPCELCSLTFQDSR